MTQADRPVDPLVVVHERAAREFRIEIGGHTAVLNYELSPGVIEFTHTGVPPEFRGRGIAAVITRAGLEFAKAEHLAVVPSCSYVAAYIRRHPEYADLVRAE